MDQLVQQLQQQLAEQERANLEKDNELHQTEEAAFSNASFAYMWELAYTDASQQQVIFMNKYEVAKAELESVSEALKVARIGNGALKIHYCLPCYTDCTPAPTPPRPACHANPYWSWRKSL